MRVCIASAVTLGCAKPLETCVYIAFFANSVWFMDHLPAFFFRLAGAGQIDKCFALIRSVFALDINE